MCHTSGKRCSNYKNAPVDIDGSQIGVSEIDLPEENLISIIFSLSTIEAQEKHEGRALCGTGETMKRNTVPDPLWKASVEIAEKRHQPSRALVPGNEDR